MLYEKQGTLMKILTWRYRFSYWTYRKRHRDQTAIIHVTNVVRAKEYVWWRRMRTFTHFDVHCKIVLWKTLQLCRIIWLDRVRIEIILLYCELSLINPWCCRADANINSWLRNINSLRLRRSPSWINISQSAFHHHALIAIIHGKVNLFLKYSETFTNYNLDCLCYWRTLNFGFHLSLALSIIINKN